jgi:hypothetical protein
MKGLDREEMYVEKMMKSWIEGKKREYIDTNSRRGNYFYIQACFREINRCLVNMIEIYHW